MRFLAVLLGVFLAAGIARAQADIPVTPPPVKGRIPAVPPKEEPMGKIAGIEIARPDGTFLGLEVVNNNFKLTFYDKKKKPTAMDVDRATARWPNPRSPGDNRTVLNGSGVSLVGAKPVLPPYTFNVYLTLLRGEGDSVKAVESYVIPFRG